MNVDVNVVIAVYQEKINELTNENLMLKAMLRQKENSEKEPTQEG